MIKLHFGKLLKLPVKLNQRVFFIDDEMQLCKGVIHSIDIYYLDSGKAADVDFVVHPVIDGVENDTARFFTDYEFGLRLFKSKRKGQRFLYGLKSQK